MKTLTIVIGLMLGGTATFLWQYLAKWFADRTFWRSCHELTQKLIQDPGSDDFFQHYFALLRSLGIYLGKTTCRVAITITPIVLALYFFSPMIARRQAEQATGLFVHPEQNVVLSAEGTQLATVGKEFEWPANNAETLRLRTTNWEQEIDFRDTFVATNSAMTSALYQSCGYHVVLDPRAPKLLLIRPTSNEINPLWPYMNDYEFVFWMCLCLASGAMGMLLHQWPGKKPKLASLYVTHQPTAS